MLARAYGHVGACALAVDMQSKLVKMNNAGTNERFSLNMVFSLFLVRISILGSLLSRLFQGFVPQLGGKSMLHSARKDKCSSSYFHRVTSRIPNHGIGVDLYYKLAPINA